MFLPSRAAISCATSARQHGPFIEMVIQAATVGQQIDLWKCRTDTGYCFPLVMRSVACSQANLKRSQTHQQRHEAQTAANTATEFIIPSFLAQTTSKREVLPPVVAACIRPRASAQSRTCRRACERVIDLLTAREMCSAILSARSTGQFSVHFAHAASSAHTDR